MRSQAELESVARWLEQHYPSLFTADSHVPVEFARRIRLAGLADQADKNEFAILTGIVMDLHASTRAARSALSQLLAEPFSPRCRQNARQLLDQKPPAKPAAPRAPKQPTSTS